MKPEPAHSALGLPVVLLNCYSCSRSLRYFDKFLFRPNRYFSSDFILVRKNPHHIKVSFQDRKEKINVNFQAAQYDIKQHFELI